MLEMTVEFLILGPQDWNATGISSSIWSDPEKYSISARSFSQFAQLANDIATGTPLAETRRDGIQNTQKSSTGRFKWPPGGREPHV